jgi:hypothetical protein
MTPLIASGAIRADDGGKGLLLGYFYSFYPASTVGMPIGSALGLWWHNRYPAEHILPMIGIGGVEMLIYHLSYGQKQLRLKDEGEGYMRAHVGALLMGLVVVPLSQVLYLQLANVSTKRDADEDGALIQLREEEINIDLPQIESRYLPLPARNGMREKATYIQLIKIAL